MNQQGRAGWLVLSAVVAALSAVVSAAVVVRQLHDQEQRTALRETLDALGRFDDEWASDRMTSARGAAASSLLQERPSSDVEDVLDFFDEIAFLLQRGALDEEIVWYRFYWPMASYWQASQSYVDRTRRKDPDAWSALEQEVTRLASVERHKRKHAAADGKPSEEQIRDFLNGEVDAGECTDDQDEEVRRTPL